LKDKNFLDWSKNRKNSYLAKFQSWRLRPLGAFVRALEIAFIGAPLQQIVRSNNDIDEIRHLLPSLHQIGSEGDYVVSAARVTTKNGLILLESGHVITPHLSSHSYLSGNLHDEVRTLLKKNPSRDVHEFVFMLPKQDYFYHFLIDYLPQIIRIKHEFRGLIVMVNQDESSYVFEYLDLHGVMYEKTTAKIIAPESIVVPNYGSIGMQQVQSFLQTSTINEVKLVSATPRIAFLRFRGSRHDAQFEDKLKTHLLERGFKIFDPDSLSVPEQIKLFSEAYEVFAIHGGVLANLIYCRQGTTVQEVFTHPYRTLFFQAISRDLKLNYSSYEAQDYLSDTFS
jgi:hypothetical protein